MSAAPIRSLRRLRSLGLGLALAAPLLLQSACRPIEPPTGPLASDSVDDKIEAQERFVAKHPGDAIARRDLAHLYWLHRADAAAAVPILDALAKGGDPVAQASRMLIAETRLNFKTARTWAHTLIEGAAQLEAEDRSKGEKSAKQGHVRPSRDDRRAARRRRRAGIAAGGPVDPALALGLAEIAAQLLGAHHGELVDDDDDFVAFFERLDRSALPVEVTRPLLSQRAAIARRMQDPNYREYYEAAGCVHAWTVGEVEGTHGELELREHSGEPLRVDPDAALIQLSCVVRVWNPRPLAGSRRIATSLSVPGSQLRLELSAQEAFRAYLDGVLIYRSDRNDRWPAKGVLLDLEVAPGSHRLEVHVALPRDKAWILVRATDDQGRAIPSSSASPGMLPSANAFRGDVPPKVVTFDAQGPGLDPQIYDPWRRVLAASDAIVDGDSDRAERWLADLDRYAPNFAEAQVMSARFEARDPTRDATTSAARERQALEAALALDPSLEAARVRLLELGLNRGETAEVLKSLEERPKGTLDHISGDLLRYRAYLARGSESLAEAALRDAAKRNPRSCDVLRLQRQLAQDRNEVALVDTLVAASSHCPGTLPVRAGHAELRGDPKAALGFLDEALARTPDNTDLLLGTAAFAIAGKDYARARDAYKRILELNPYSSRARIGLADLSAEEGDTKAARASLRASIAILPANSALREIGTHLGIADDLEELRIDAAPLLAAYVSAARAAGTNDPYEGASEVLVLDRSVARIYADGSARQIVHTVAQVRTKEAIDRYGEMTIPDGARLLTFHSVKPSGAVIEPELISGKAGLSLRGLEIGDFVEFEFLIDEERHGYLPGHVDLAVFRFQSYNIPYHRSELVVMHPAEMPIKVESRGGAPVATRERRGDRVIQTWRVDASRRRGVEPSARDSLDELPSVRVYTDLDLEAWIDALALRVMHTQRSNPELRLLAKTETQGIDKGDRAKQLRVLWRWVLENIEEAGDITVGATQTLAARKGNRLMLLRTLLGEVGIRSELWVGRDRFGPSLVEGGHPMPESYGAPLLIVWIDGEPIPVLTNSKVVPLGYLPVNLAESPALRVRLTDGEPPSGKVTTPAVAESLADLRRYDLEIELDAAGDGAIRGSITLQGMEAIAWREGLRALDRDRLDEAFEQAELSVLAQGASLDLLTFEIDNERELSKPLVLRFTANARGLGVRQGQDLVLRAAIVPMNLGLGYAGLPERNTGLVIPYAPIQEAVIRLKLKGFALRVLPDAASITTDAGGYTLAVEGQPGGSELVLKTRSRLRPGIIEAADYDELVELTRSIRSVEDETIRAR